MKTSGLNCKVRRLACGHLLTYNRKRGLQHYIGKMLKHVLECETAKNILIESKKETKS